MERFTVMNEERMIELDKPQTEVIRLSEGLKFGDGNISCKGESADVLQQVDAAIAAPEILVAVDIDETGNTITDDGCGDGRGVNYVYKSNQVLKRSLHRAKVFGGGAAMGVASLVGLGRASGQPLQSVFEASIHNLQTNEMDFGAHTDDHEHPGASGCGAIDKAPQAIAAAVKYEQPIRDVINALGVDADGLDDVYANYRGYAAEVAQQNDFSGLIVVESIKNLGKIVKELGGAHKERRIILNTVRGYTVNQSFVRLKTNDQAQVFAVDTWRLEDIANDLNQGDESAQHQALLSELVYTLGVAAVLTDGELPVDMLQPAEALVTS